MEDQAWDFTTNIPHLTECLGCERCDHLMEFYMACDGCGRWGHKDSSHQHIMIGSEFFCEICQSQMREQNDPRLTALNRHKV